jgi:hypothetical protein
MLRTFSVALLLWAGTLAACSPTFNWRQVRAEPSTLQAMMPCKPEMAQRPVPMAGRQVELKVLGCDAGGASFALLFADIGEAGRSGEVLAQWKQATLSNLRAVGAQELPFLPKGGVALRESVQVIVSGKRSDGSDVESHAAYFAKGSQVFQAVIYAPKLNAEWADPFFAGLSLQ